MKTNDTANSREIPVPRAVAKDALQASQEPFRNPTGQPPRILWYRNEIGPRLKQDTRELFESYAGIPGEELEEHLHDVRDEAWPLGQYPCIGLWGFLHSSFRHSLAYTEVLERVHQGATLLDMGCGLGQDLRRLAADGAPTEKLWACDVNSELWRLGYQLFRDEERLKAHFVRVDVRSEKNELVGLRQSVDVILAYQILHLFGLEEQTKILKKIVGMSKERTVVVGSQMGRINPIEKEGKWGKMFYHTPETFTKMWKVAEVETGTKWHVQCTMVELGDWGLQKDDYSWMDPEYRALDFVVRKLGGSR